MVLKFNVHLVKCRLKYGLCNPPLIDYGDNGKSSCGSYLTQQLANKDENFHVVKKQGYY